MAEVLASVTVADGVSAAQPEEPMGSWAARMEAAELLRWARLGAQQGRAELGEKLLASREMEHPARCAPKRRDTLPPVLPPALHLRVCGVDLLMRSRAQIRGQLSLELGIGSFRRRACDCGWSAQETPRAESKPARRERE